MEDQSLHCIGQLKSGGADEQAYFTLQLTKDVLHPDADLRLCGIPREI